VDRWCELLRWHGIAADPADLLLPRPAAHASTAGTVLVHPGAAFPARRWPTERFGAVARALADDGHRIVVTGTAAERALAGAVATETDRPRSVRVVAGQTGLAELAALVADAELVVCGDTGVAHLATAYRVPSVLLFGPTAPAKWGPTIDHDRHVVLWRGETGDPFAEAPAPGLLRIGTAEVIDAATGLLARLARVAPRDAMSDGGEA
jgi:ADP-heptose:LPS heptosyltransferase